jgi:hypothetical protein
VFVIACSQVITDFPGFADAQFVFGHGGLTLASFKPHVAKIIKIHTEAEWDSRRAW